jgi:hypothetical protein
MTIIVIAASCARDEGDIAGYTQVRMVQVNAGVKNGNLYALPLELAGD